MLFTPEHARWILYSSPHTGEPKTETRRLWKRWHVKVGGIYHAQTKMFDSDSRFVRIKVTHRWLEPLMRMQLESVRREGFAKWEDFIAVLAKINKMEVIPYDIGRRVKLKPGQLDVEQQVHVVRFQVVEPIPGGLKT